MRAVLLIFISVLISPFFEHVRAEDCYANAGGNAQSILLCRAKGARLKAKTEKQIFDEALERHRQQQLKEAGLEGHTVNDGFQCSLAARAYCTTCPTADPKYCSDAKDREEKRRQELERQAQKEKADRKAAERKAAADRKRAEAKQAEREKQAKKDGKPATEQPPEKHDAGKSPGGQGISPALANSTPPGVCDYDTSTPIRSAFEEKKALCIQTSAKAAQACNAEANQQIRAAIAEAKAAAQKVFRGEEKSNVVACDTFSKSSNKLKDALKDYQQSCLPAKNECEDACMATADSAATIAEVSSTNQTCFQESDKVYSSIESQLKNAGQKHDTCKSYNDPLDQSYKDVNALITSVGEAGLCERGLTEKCDGGFGDDCVDAVQGNKASLNQELVKTAGTDGSSGVEKESLGTASSPDGFESRGLSPKSGRANLGSAGTAKGPTGASSKVSRAASRFGKRGSSEFYKSGKRRKKGKKYSFGKYRGQRGLASAGGAGAGGRGAGGQNSQSQLGRYLPGGSSDPNRRLHGVDGITGPTGPSIFEKVTRRYHIHMDRLFQEKRRGS